MEAGHLRKYGITRAQRATMFEAQGRVCAACGSADPRSKIGWHLDHDHETGAVRALLCQPCNLTMGYNKDCPERIMAVAIYAEKHK